MSPAAAAGSRIHGPNAGTGSRPPCSAGLRFYLAFVGGALAVLPLTRTVLGLIGLTTVMFLTGLIDDIRELRPQSKLVVQLACGFLLYVVGYHFNDALPWWLDLGIVVFWVAAITNAMNLLDNMNGLAAGTAVIAGVFRLLLYMSTGNVEGAVATSVFIGAVAGFLVFNFPRASVFMGDTGSFTIGFVLAALNLTSSEAYSKTLFSVLIFPVLVLAIPIFDTAFVALHRYFSGRAVSQGGRDHTSHRLVAVGLSETVAVLILWAISIAAGALAMVLYDRGFSYGWFGGSLAVLGLILFGVVLARVRVYAEGEEPAGGAQLPTARRAALQAAVALDYRRRADDHRRAACRDVAHRSRTARRDGVAERFGPAGAEHGCRHAIDAFHAWHVSRGLAGLRPQGSTDHRRRRRAGGGFQLGGRSDSAA